MRIWALLAQALAYGFLSVTSEHGPYVLKRSMV